MLLCDACGSLKKPIKRRGSVERVCPKCDPITIPPGGTRPSGTPRRGHGNHGPQGNKPSGGGFQRADQLTDPSTEKPTNQPTDPEPARSPSQPTDTPDRAAASPGQARSGAPQRAGDAEGVAGPYFPFDTMRKHQARFLQDVRATLKEGKVLVAQAPTGIGKTAGVLAPALEVARETRSRIFFLTPKQSQHKVAIDTLREAARAAGEEIVVSDMISKQAMCPRPEAEMMNGRAFGEFCMNEVANNRCSYYKNDEQETVRTLARSIHHVDEAVALSKEDHVCPYAALTETARVADVVVLDYNHFFSDMLDATLDRLDLELDDTILIIDEAHNLPGRIRDHLSTRLHPAQLSEAVDEARGVGAYGEAKFLDHLRLYVEGLQGDPEKKMKPVELIVQIEKLIPKAFRLAQPDVNTVIDQLKKVAERVLEDEARSACDDVVTFLETWPPHPRVPERAVLRRWSPEDEAIVHQVLDASILARTIFDQVQGAVLMSGTLFPMEMYSKILGVPPDRAVHELYENPFPREHRRVAIDTSVSSGYKERGPQTYRKIAARIAEVCQATPGNVAVFFPSYAFGENVASYLPPSGRLTVNEERGLSKSQKEQLVTQLRRADGNALLLGVMGGSLSEGYDFVEDGDNLLDAVLVVGIPYAPPTLEVKALEGFYDHAFGNRKGWLYGYLAPAIQKVLQAAGRAIRASHHKAFVGLLDHRYTKANVQKWLPPDMEPVETTDAAEEARRFFG